ncbi:hypothetical protein [Streptomyces erythrochromogenes]|uniref:hypothetical protein n=1 Tax=Streptomyces erythrochromogenes TaxID=285574 RepID=UPI0036C65132
MGPPVVSGCRRGLEETARVVLRCAVRTTAALDHGDTDFVHRLRERHGDDGTLLGCAVALPG